MSHIKIKLKDQQVQELKDVCKSFNNEASELINVLHKAQGIFGYLPAEVQEIIAHELKISVAKVYGVVSFYSFFSMTPKGKHPISFRRSSSITSKIRDIRRSFKVHPSLRIRVT